MIVIGSNTSDNGKSRFTEDVSHFMELRQNRQLALLTRSANDHGWEHVSNIIHSVPDTFCYLSLTFSFCLDKSEYLGLEVLENAYIYCSGSKGNGTINYRLGTVNSNTVNSKLPLNSKFQFPGYLHLLFILIVLIVCFMLYFEFPLNSKQNLADKWLRINRTQPVTQKTIMCDCMWRISVSNGLQNFVLFSYCWPIDVDYSGEIGGM